MEEKDTFTCAFDLYERIMVHATGNPAKVIAVSLAAGVVFVAAALAVGVRAGLLGQEE